MYIKACEETQYDGIIEHVSVWMKYSNKTVTTGSVKLLIKLQDFTLVKDQPFRITVKYKQLEVVYPHQRTEQHTPRAGY